MNKELYSMIFKRKSFHIFRGLGEERLSAEDLSDIEAAYKGFEHLCPDLKTLIRIVPREQTSCKRGGEYCVLFYSEKKDNYLQNIGYLGQQLDLYLVSKNIGTLWCGLAKPDVEEHEGLGFVIMMVIAKVDDKKKFRRDMFKAKRKGVEEIWRGETLPGVADIARFAPSACNSQPWTVDNKDGVLSVCRYKKPEKIGIFPSEKMVYFNRIDIGIFLCVLELCLMHEGIDYKRELFVDHGSDAEQTPVANYSLGAGNE